MYEEDFKKAGKLFREIRKGNHISGQELAQGIISYSSLNKFEVGKNHLTFLDLARLLKRMNVDLDSFYEQVASTKEIDLSLRGRYGQFLREVRRDYEANDLSTIETNAKQLQEDFGHDGNVLNLIELTTLAALIKESEGRFHLKETIVEQLEDHFMQLQNWDAFNLSVFNNTAPLASTKMIEVVAKELVYKDQVGPLHSNILTTLTNIVDLLFRKNQQKEAKAMLAKVKHLLGKDEPLLLVRFKVQFLENLFELDIEKGRDKNRILIQQLRDLGADRLASSYEDYLQKYLSSNK
ncbi:MAG: helix-turn-helix domain-containing protein [Oenococcus sp.]|uniref:Rgg/GadR/MutR family transcriptional regulator n=1 Tax=Oenococcus sp. TaxID=1979414 RepID=UPI0039E9B2F6